MAAERDVQKLRSVQVGILMRSYRESFALGAGRRGLSQAELLRRMGEVDDVYETRYSHGTVSRWESGSTRPSVDRLRVFGMALNLSETEVAGLILLAGLRPALYSPYSATNSSLIAAILHTSYHFALFEYQFLTYLSAAFAASLHTVFIAGEFGVFAPSRRLVV